MSLVWGGSAGPPGDWARICPVRRSDGYRYHIIFIWSTGTRRSAVERGCSTARQEDLWRQHHFTTAAINQNPPARPARPALPVIYANILTIFSRPQLKSNLSH